MERRNAIIAVLAATIGLMSSKAAVAQGKKPDTVGLGEVDPLELPHGSVTFHLDSFENYQFLLANEKVVLTPTEIMRALKGK